jgi:2-C-methyl-D-erythritol 4-phosphate cytidylyltransferase/2-C-methyl-D-erythritol 2,4-cyclodiphosphate synthase
MATSSLEPGSDISHSLNSSNSQKAEPKHWVIIPAAGVGSRMQSKVPKQYLKIENRTVLEYSAQAFLTHPCFDQVYIGISAGDEYFELESLSHHNRISRFAGGRERCDTVLNGLKEIAPSALDHDWVWVHDAARPCLCKEDIDRLIAKLAVLQESEGVILAARVVDTIKLSKDESKIDATLDRNELWRAFTPQVFRFGVLRKALETCQSKSLLVTDEASAIERLGGKPHLVEGSDENLKITRPNDLRIAQGILANREKLEQNEMQMPRIGNGYDVHAFCEGDEIILGGVSIPYTKAFVAHSDGDVLIHAIMDAMLGALALGDIGKHFPDTDDKWKGANSRDLLVAVNGLIAQKGYLVSNLDSVIIAQAPKMAPHIELMQKNIAQDLKVGVDQVSVKATTTERLGFTGREEGIACQASVLLVPLSTHVCEG